MEMEMEMSKFPKELVMEILSWVPAKYLLQSKWVCKSWFNLITDSKFIKMHLDRSTQLVLNKPSLMVCTSTLGETVLSLHSLNFTNNNNALPPPPLKRLSLPFTFKSSQDHQILGSCNGLVCLQSIYPFQRISIWNPCTNEFKELHDMSNGYKNCTNTIGFGYDHTIDDYKVVCNTCYFNLTGYLETEVKVYSLGTNAWKIGESCRYEIVDENPGLLMDGVLYFMAKKPDYLDIIIISFDIVNEKYSREITMPQEVQDKFKRSRQPPNEDVDYANLGVEFQKIQGCFCISNVTVEKFVDVWVMKKDDYGVETWAKSFTIKPAIIESCLVHILGFGKNIEIVMLKDDKDLVWYNRNNGETRDIVTLLDGWSICLSFESFIESLVSINQVTNSGRKRRRLDIETFVSLN